MRGQKYEFNEEQLTYIDENWGEESAHSMKLKFGCSWIAVVKAAIQMGHEAPGSNAWTYEDELLLRQLVEEYHYTIIADRMGRSENAIYLKARRLGITLIMNRRGWTTEEETEFSRLWGTITIEDLAKKLKRTVFALKVKAIRMKLGAMRINNYEKLLISDVVDILNVSRDRITTTWKKLGLKIQMTSVSKQKAYMYVTVEDLWDFLEQNLLQWDSREVEHNILGEEPSWMEFKRNQDLVMPPREYKEWTIEELEKAKELLLLGANYEVIAVAIDRTSGAVSDKMRVLEKSIAVAKKIEERSYSKGKKKARH